MPTYDYVCKSCEHAFEKFQSITARNLRKCPSCGKPKLQRLIGTGSGVIFKGSGFYETDYRSASYKKDAKAEKDAATKSTESKSKDAKKDKKSPSKDTGKDVGKTKPKED